MDTAKEIINIIMDTAKENCTNPDCDCGEDASGDKEPG